MQTYYLTKMHTKCIAILELIQQNNNRMQVLESNLHHCLHGHRDNPIRLFQRPKDIQQDIEDRQKIAKRLENYYLNTSIKMNDNIFKQLSK